MQDNNIELLAPAGSFDSLRAAIASGANAVYLGLNKFSARAKAANFDIENIAQTLEYAHLFGVKVYVAMNTLMYQNELEAALKMVEKLHTLKVDALIVQDLGFVSLLKERLPNLVLHASTQMGIHNLEGALAAKRMGIKRVILSRETTLKDIKNIRAGCDVELEYFVHGALCVGFSGNCYLCSVLMRQSGNRGRCLQLCRKRFEYKGRSGYWLSTKDLMLAKRVKELVEAGVTSFKIEGRMRRPKYVEEVVKVYRDVLGGGAFGEDEKRRLEAVYVRGGGSDGFLDRANAKTICDVDKGHMGAPSMDEGARCEPKLLVRMECVLEADKEIRLKLIHSDVSVEVGGVVAERSKSSPLDREAVIKSLNRLGGSEFRADEIDVVLGDNVFVSVSALNDLRRNGVAELRKKLVQAYDFESFLAKNTLFDGVSGVSGDIKNFKRVVMVDSLEKFWLIKEGVDCIIYAPFKYDRADIERFIYEVGAEAGVQGVEVYLSLPVVARGEDAEVIKKILESKKIEGVVVNNLYGLELARGKKKIMLGLGMNLINGVLKDCQRILSIEAKGEFLLSDIVYAFGLPQVMTLCHCFSKNCHTCLSNNAVLKDETGAQFLLKRMKMAHCYHYLYNNIPINAVAVLNNRKSECGYLYDFVGFKIDELKNFDYDNLAGLFDKFSKGHLYRGVE